MEELEKVALLGALDRILLLRGIGREFGPTASSFLKSNPVELRAIQGLIKNIPKGGTHATLDFRTVAPGFSRTILQDRKIGGEVMNRLLPASKRMYKPPPESDTKGKILDFLKGAPAPSGVIGVPGRHSGGMALPLAAGAGLGALLLRAGNPSERRGIFT